MDFPTHSLVMIPAVLLERTTKHPLAAVSKSRIGHAAILPILPEESQSENASNYPTSHGVLPDMKPTS